MIENLKYLYESIESNIENSNPENVILAVLLILIVIAGFTCLYIVTKVDEKNATQLRIRKEDFRKDLDEIKEKIDFMYKGCKWVDHDKNVEVKYEIKDKND